TVATGGGRTRDRAGEGGDRRGRGDAELLLEVLQELAQLEHAHVGDGVEDLVLGQGCHVVQLSSASAAVSAAGDSVVASSVAVSAVGSSAAGSSPAGASSASVPAGSAAGSIGTPPRS